MSAPLLERVPPQSLEAEQATLGAMLVEREAIRQVADDLQPEDFYSPQHQILYRVLVDLYHQGKPADLVTVQSGLEDRGQFEQTGGVSYLLTLQEGAPTAAGVRHYAGIVREKSILRRRLHAALRIRENPESPEAIAAMAAALAEEVAPRELPTPLAYADLARAEIPSVDYLVSDLLPRNSKAALVGDTGVGKSWLALDLALSVANGDKAWGLHAVPRPGIVLIFDEENGDDELARRISKLAHARGLLDGDLPIYIWSHLGAHLDDSEGFALLRGLVRQYQPALVILDSFVRFHRQDENSNSGMAIITAALDALIADTEAAVLVCHHPNKAPMIGTRSAVDRARGAKEIVAGLDTYLFCHASPDGAIIVNPAKVRRGIAPPPFSVRLVEEEAGGLSVVGLGSVDEVQDKLAQCGELICAKLLDAGGRLDRPVIMAACQEAGFRSRTAAQALARLTDEGQIQKAGKLGRRQLYSLEQEALL